VIVAIELAQAAAQAGHHPWWRLAIFVPVSVLLGVGVTIGRRIVRDRGWFGR